MKNKVVQPETEIKVTPISKEDLTDCHINQPVINPVDAERREQMAEEAAGDCPVDGE